MSKKSRKPARMLTDVVKDLGRYPVEAFEFLHWGLDYTVHKRHGVPTLLQVNLRKFLEWLREQGVELPVKDVESMVEKGEVSPAILGALKLSGGLEVIGERRHLHVSGEDLCWGLRDLALRQWGLMAPVVLRHWGIRSTRDFGEMVFALVDSNLLEKQSEDRIDDFDNVYAFDEVFDRSYKITFVKEEQESGEDAECADEEDDEPHGE